MEGLTKLVNSLRPAEINLLKALYRSNCENKKRVQFFNLLLAGKVSCDREARQMIYGKNSGSAYSQLKARLRTDIHNVILLNESSQRNDGAAANACFDTRKTILQAELLYSRGLHEEASTILTKASRSAKRFELHHEEVMVADLTRVNTLLHQDQQELATQGEQLTSLLQNVGHLEQAKQLHLRLILPELFGTKSESSYRTSGFSGLRELKQKWEESASARIGWYYLFSSMIFHANLREFEKALQPGEELLEMVQASEPLNTRQNLAGTHLELSRIHLQLGHYETAQQYAEKAHQGFRADPGGQLAALECRFIGELNNDTPQLALNTAQRVLQCTTAVGSIADKAQWGLFLASAYFKAGSIKECEAAIKRYKPASRDKEGWITGYCVLSAMTLIEAGKVEWLDYRQDTLKKQLCRHVQKDTLGRTNRRPHAIMAVIRSLTRHDYDVSKLLQNDEKALANLQAGKDEFFYPSMGWELIRFDHWLINKSEALLENTY